MKRNGLLPAPKVPSPPQTNRGWEKEYRAFRRIRRSLLRTHRSEYVAVYGGKVVDSDKNKIALGLRVYMKFGYVPIYVGPVSAKVSPVVCIPSPRLRANARGS